jgi:site-specific DNA-methyltransferase (adenine-specific)
VAGPGEGGVMVKPYYENEWGKLYHGDCLEIMDFLAFEYGEGWADMVLTDPPYSTPTVASFGRQVCKRLSDLAIQEHYFTAVKGHLEIVASSNAPFLVFCDDIYSAVLTGLFYQYKQTGLLVWDKKRIGMGKPYRKRHELIFFAHRESVPLNSDEVSHIPTVLEYPIKKEHHGAEKPVDLLALLIGGLCKPGGTVFDPFGGSGSMAMAAETVGRKWVICEMEEQYCEIIAKRLQARLN